MQLFIIYIYTCMIATKKGFGRFRAFPVLLYAFMGFRCFIAFTVPYNALYSALLYIAL